MSTNWPEPVRSAVYEPSLSLLDLAPCQKQTVWKHLKTSFAEKAKEVAIIMSDPNIQMLISTFDASPQLEIEFVPVELKHLAK